MSNFFQKLSSILPTIELKFYHTVDTVLSDFDGLVARLDSIAAKAKVKQQAAADKAAVLSAQANTQAAVITTAQTASAAITAAVDANKAQ